MTRQDARWRPLHVDGLLQATDRDLEPMPIRCPGLPYSLECKDDATSFSLLLLRPVPGRPEFVPDDPLPEGGILLNIFGVPHGRVLFLSRDVHLNLTLSTLKLAD